MLSRVNDATTNSCGVLPEPARRALQPALLLPDPWHHKQALLLSRALAPPFVNALRLGYHQAAPALDGGLHLRARVFGEGGLGGWSWTTEYWGWEWGGEATSWVSPSLRVP